MVIKQKERKHKKDGIGVLIMPKVLCAVVILSHQSQLEIAAFWIRLGIVLPLLFAYLHKKPLIALKEGAREVRCSRAAGEAAKEKSSAFCQSEERD